MGRPWESIRHGEADSQERGPDDEKEGQEEADRVLRPPGQDTQSDRTKREFLGEWTRAVNEHGGFGRWAWDVSFNTADIGGLLEKHVACTATHSS